MNKRIALFLLLALCPMILSGQEDKAERIREYLSSTYPAKVVNVKVTGKKVRVKGWRPAGKGYFLAEITPWEDIDAEGLGDNLIPLRLKRFRRCL